MYRFEGKKKRARGKTEGRTVARYGSVFQQKKAPGNEHSTGELPPWEPLIKYRQVEQRRNVARKENRTILLPAMLSSWIADTPTAEKVPDRSNFLTHCTVGPSSKDLDPKEKRFSTQWIFFRFHTHIIHKNQKAVTAKGPSQQRNIARTFQQNESISRTSRECHRIYHPRQPLSRTPLFVC